MAKLSQYKDCEIVGAWIKSITNHMYWCAASAPDGDGKLMVGRWKSLMSHLIDQHDDCFHLPLVIRPVAWKATTVLLTTLLPSYWVFRMWGCIAGTYKQIQTNTCTHLKK